MFAKIVMGKDLAGLQQALNDFLTDFGKMIVQNNENKPEELRPLKIYNVQQFIMQEVDSKAVSIINQQPIIKVSICLLLICGYE